MSASYILRDRNQGSLRKRFPYFHSFLQTHSNQFPAIYQSRECLFLNHRSSNCGISNDYRMPLSQNSQTLTTSNPNINSVLQSRCLNIRWAGTNTVRRYFSTSNVPSVTCHRRISGRAWSWIMCSLFRWHNNNFVAICAPILGERSMSQMNSRPSTVANTPKLTRMLLIPAELYCTYNFWVLYSPDE